MTNKRLRNDFRLQLLKGIEGKAPFSSKYWYYVKDLRDNLFCEMKKEHVKMFDEGSGSELHDKRVPAKAKAIDSSSMLSYNFFSWIDETHTLAFDNIIYDKVFFEVKLSTLKTGNFPANMDVVLVSEDNKTVLFIESKFVEYLDYGKCELSASYKDRNKYFDDNELIDDIISLVGKYNIIKGNYQYGIKQNICHLIGISNLKYSSKSRALFLKKYGSRYKCILDADSYIFKNIVFDPDMAEAHALFESYRKDLNAFSENLPTFVRQFVDNNFVVTYNELYNRMVGPFLTERRSYLFNRYIRFNKQ